jgi:CheY-like chemotaxis protein
MIGEHISLCVLSIEDSPEDFEVIRRCLQKVAPGTVVVQCQNGDEALAWLHTHNDGQSARRPDIILLDLNLPGIDGRELLKILKNDPALKSIPVVILSTSNNERDVDDCYSNGANAYLIKPSTVKNFTNIAQALYDFWQCVCFPHSDDMHLQPQIGLQPESVPVTEPLQTS